MKKNMAKSLGKANASACISSQPFEENLASFAPQKIQEDAPRKSFDVSPFITFLRKDNSFLTPWSFNPAADDKQGNACCMHPDMKNHEEKEDDRLIFQPGSFFSVPYDVYFGFPKTDQMQGSRCEQQDVKKGSEDKHNKDKYPSKDRKMMKLKVPEIVTKMLCLIASTVRCIPTGRKSSSGCQKVREPVGLSSVLGFEA